MPIINRVVSFGDSLSDRGKMYKRLLWGLIPLAKVSGLEGKSPYGRFTNQYTWLDHWAAALSENQYIKQKEDEGYTPEGILQLLLTDPDAKNKFRNSFSLNSSDHVNYYSQAFYETYCEGGATAGDWSKTFTWNIGRYATRRIVNTLEHERKLFLAEEEAKYVTQEERETALISIFIGANDLITVNDPSKLSDKEIEAVIEKAVRAQMEHIQALIDAGYRNFALKNLPNLGLTPRFQKKGWVEIGKGITEKYNEKLEKEYEELEKLNRNKKLQCKLYNINQIFQKVYDNCEDYGFEKSKLSSYFKDSAEFNKDIHQAAGYMFWDEVHPSAKMHKVLEEKINKKIRKDYDIAPAIQGYHLQYTEGERSEDEKKRVQTRCGTTILVYFKNQKLTIGYCGKAGYLEEELDELTQGELKKYLPLVPSSSQKNWILPRPLRVSQEAIKDAESPADKPFDILDGLIRDNGGYGFEEASLMFDFARAYKERWTGETFSSFWGSWFMRSRIDPYRSSLKTIFYHALKDGGERSRCILIDLGWIDKSNNLRAPFNKLHTMVSAHQEAMLIEKNLITKFIDLVM